MHEINEESQPHICTIARHIEEGKGIKYRAIFVVVETHIVHNVYK